MGKRKKADLTPREPQPPTGYQPPTAAAAPAAANGLAPDDDKLFVKAIKKAGEKIKDKHRQLEQAKIALRNAKAEFNEAECALQQLANEELPLFKQTKSKGRKKSTTVTTVTESVQQTLPLETPTPPTESTAPRKRGRPRKDADAPATAT